MSTCILPLEICTAIIPLLLVLVFFSKWRGIRRAPPGPPGVPLFGNALQIPNDHQWLLWDKWKNEYGDVMSIKIFGTPHLILSSYKAAKELLDDRGLIYSDRPPAIMAGEIVGWNRGMGYSPGPPNARFREMRRLFHTFIGPRACTLIEGGVKDRNVAFSKEARALRVAQQDSVIRLVKKLIDDPSNFIDHARETTSGLILLLAYGYDVYEESEFTHNDPLHLVQIVQDAMGGFAVASEPGRWWVDELPILRHIPGSFLPFQRAGKRMRRDLERLYEVPFSFVMREMANGTARPSFISTWLEARAQGNSKGEMELVQAAAASLYSGTSVLTPSSIITFMLAMILYPHVQARAQEEVDRILKDEGGNLKRLPSVDDRLKMPYVDALMKEVWRWGPSVPLGLPHMLNQDDEYRGYSLKKGTVVWANIWTILHDESVFPDPFSFKPERYLTSRVDKGLSDNDPDPSEVVMSAFGFGRRICPGLNLAENTVFLSISSVLALFTVSKELDPNTRKEVEPSVQYDGFVSHPKPFKCRIAPRVAPSELTILLNEGTAE
ncbi:hypothetical protein AX16_002324 [Volvariella volvacea WC 439]|nr:hypothetical protein AX16_002324 [Volvariella volvacea WC 439]